MLKGGGSQHSLMIYTAGKGLRTWNSEEDEIEKTHL